LHNGLLEPTRFGRAVIGPHALFDVRHPAMPARASSASENQASIGCGGNRTISGVCRQVHAELNGLLIGSGAEFQLGQFFIPYIARVTDRG
jgi:hypothetical protein